VVECAEYSSAPELTESNGDTVDQIIETQRR
jgi:hypothetical protein